MFVLIKDLHLLSWLHVNFQAATKKVLFFLFWVRIYCILGSNARMFIPGVRGMSVGRQILLATQHNGGAGALRAMRSFALAPSAL
jgi:hypothetical protein